MFPSPLAAARPRCPDPGARADFRVQGLGVLSLFSRVSAFGVSGFRGHIRFRFLRFRVLAFWA